MVRLWEEHFYCVFISVEGLFELREEGAEVAGITDFYVSQLLIIHIRKT